MAEKSISFAHESDWFIPNKNASSNILISKEVTEALNCLHKE
jgi:hypothetical protein